MSVGIYGVSLLVFEYPYCMLQWVPCVFFFFKQLIFIDWYLLFVMLYSLNFWRFKLRCICMFMHLIQKEQPFRYLSQGQYYKVISIPSRQNGKTLSISFRPCPIHWNIAYTNSNIVSSTAIEITYNSFPGVLHSASIYMVPIPRNNIKQYQSMVRIMVVKSFHGN